MTQKDKAELFRSLHQKGDPIVLYNIWDAGGAKAVTVAGAKAVATGSWSVADAHGYADGEEIPLDLLAIVAKRIVETVDVPVSIDFEGCYSVDPDGVEINVGHILDTGVVGINFEDQVVGGEGMYSQEDQAARIAAAKRAGDNKDVPFVINARTDLFLKNLDESTHTGLISEAKDRAAAYAEAGAGSFFVPWLKDPELIADICENVSLPVNVMMRPGMPNIATLSSLGVARISYGPGPYRKYVASLTDQFKGLK